MSAGTSTTRSNDRGKACAGVDSKDRHGNRDRELEIVTGRDKR
jgi:hypothetical protein